MNKKHLKVVGGLGLVFVVWGCTAATLNNAKDNTHKPTIEPAIAPLAGVLKICTPIVDGNIKNARNVSMLKAKAELARGRKVKVENELKTTKNSTGERFTTSKSIHTTSGKFTRDDEKAIDLGVSDVDGVPSYCVVLDNPKQPS